MSPLPPAKIAKCLKGPDIMVENDSSSQFDWEEFERLMRNQFPFMPDEFWKQMADRNYVMQEMDNWNNYQKQIENYIWKVFNKFF
jgi:hypothetical protein